MVMELKTERVVGWLDDELIRILRFFVVSVVWGGSLGCNWPQSCRLRGLVWLILLNWLWSVWMCYVQTPFSFMSSSFFLQVWVYLKKKAFMVLI